MYRTESTDYLFMFDKVAAHAAVARALADLGAPATEPLVQALREARPMAAESEDQARQTEVLRTDLIDLLSLVGDERAAPVLRELAALEGFTNYNLRHAAEVALKRLALPRPQRGREAPAEREPEPDLNPGRERRPELAARLLAIPSPNDVEAIDELIARLRTTPLAAEVLAKSGSDRAAAALVSCLCVRELKVDVCREAESALFNLGDRAVDALEQSLYRPGKDWELLDAEDLLGRIATPRAVDALMRRLPDADADTRRMLVEALGRAGDPRAFDSVADVLRTSPEAYPRAAAAEALAGLGDPRAYDVLAAALDSDGPITQCGVARALAVLQDRRAVGILADFARRRLAKRPFGPDHVVVIPTDNQALFEMKPLMAAAEALVRLKDPQGILFWAQGRALGMTADLDGDLLAEPGLFADRVSGMGPAAIEPLVKACGLLQKSANVSFTDSYAPTGPFCALAGIEDPRAEDAFWRLISTLPFEGRARVMTDLLSMRTLGPAKMETILKRIARADPERLVRRKAVARLWSRGTPGAMAAIRDVAANDRCRTVRQFAEWVLAGGIKPGPEGERFNAEYAAILQL